MTVSVNGTTGITFNDASVQATAATGFGFKNRIINGAMVIDQRNAGASVTPTDGQYTLDRYLAFCSQASKYTVQQNAGSVTPPVGFTNYLGVTSSSAYSVGSADYFMLAQRIEGYNIADLAWGTANAQPVTLSFKVYSSLTGTFGGSIMNGGQNRNYPFSYTISSANTWTDISVTIVGDTSGTWATNNTEGIGVYFGLGMGSTLSGTAGAWAAGYKYSATGATSVVGTSGATFYITGVQLEKGSTATSFDYRPYGTELALCQRYFERIANTDTASYANGGIHFANNFRGNCDFKVTKRAVPTFTSSAASTFYVQGNNSTTAPSAISMNNASVNSAYLSATVTATLGTSQTLIDFSGSFIAFSSEL
jgi:hypothetical protein